MDRKKSCDKCGKAFGLFGISKTIPDGSVVCLNCYQKTIPKPKVSEVKCSCNECGHVWHFTSKDQWEQRGKKMSNFGKDMVQASPCTCCCGAMMPRDKVADLNQCPKCKTHNIKKELIEYEKSTN